MRERARDAGARHLRRGRRRRDRRRNAIEDQQRRRQETATDAEHARQEAHPASEQDDDQRIDRQIGDWKVEIHGSRTMSSARTAPIPVTLEYFSGRSEEHTSDLQSLMRISYAVLCL